MSLTKRNPGPSWGFPFLAWVDRITPGGAFDVMLRLGAGIGMCLMPAQRQASRAYLTRVLGHDPGWRGPNRHFGEFALFLTEKLRLQRNILPRFKLMESPRTEAFLAFCQSGEQGLFGTFHIGHSDLMGCLLRDLGRDIAIVREEVSNSMDTDLMRKTFGGHLQFVFINDPMEFLYVLKEAVEEGRSLGIQCDRLMDRDRRETFQFLGMECLFPMTIYHLGHLFNLPICFAMAGGRDEDGAFFVDASTLYRPSGRRPGAQARAHFQSVLELVEAHLRKFPYLWFNFAPFNTMESTQARE